ncbi:MAG: hypothetical protein AUH84_05415 [Thaumarchaeota archaeon 13_1_40CM_4_38_7]|nr:MAG: hypothetical protein AUH84_05415 [Thaumarchaeota archaeon 13_1_40CM_4_38_7]OLD27588.1 MAG: hypothetical protein AUI62_05505 [Thaumarchaeota archaeon 13_1_40CM_2_39_7]
MSEESGSSKNYETDKVREDWTQEWFKSDIAFFKGLQKDYFDVIRSAKTGFTFNMGISLTIVIVGIALLVNSIVFAWLYHDKDLSWSFLSGLLGASSFVTIFFRNPEKMINQAVGNLAQIQMIFKSHEIHWEFIRQYFRDRWNPELPPEKLGTIAEEIFKSFAKYDASTKEYVQEIQKYIEGSYGGAHKKATTKDGKIDNNKRTPV